MFSTLISRSSSHSYHRENSMEMDLSPTVQALRTMWSRKVQEEEKIFKPRSTVYRCRTPISSRVIDDEMMMMIKKKPTVTFDHVEATVVDEMEDSSSLPPPPASVVFKQQAQSIITLKQTMTKMFDEEKEKKKLPERKSSGNRHWHIARHVFRSGLIFGPTRRASDSIVPLLMKTHIAQNRSRMDSFDSTPTDTPFENLVDYISHHHHDRYLDVTPEKSVLKRTISDTSACIQRNKLDETIAQYETIMRHLKNYDQFMVDHPQPIPNKPIVEIEVQVLSQKNSMQVRQTQSLARNAGRTFTEFMINDLLATQSNETRHSCTAHASSQTDLNQLIKKIDSIPMEDTKTALNELDQAINSVIQEPPITPNCEVNVIIVNPPSVPQVSPKKEKTLLQRLFEGKKTAYIPSDSQMQSTRIPEELMNSYEVAKNKCFFPEEQILYATKMVKIDRRGYKQHIRILCITTERVYIITKKKSYAKEAVLLKDILGVSCTPRRDGFICFHTRETREDRGDWIFVVDHPCEFITQLFMALGKTNNNDHFLKIKIKFQHTRRNLAQVADDCTIEARPSDTFHLAYENYETLVVYAP